MLDRFAPSVLLLLASAALSQDSRPSPESLREDLRLAFEQLKTVHPRLHHAHPASAWDAAVKELEGRLDSLDAAGFWVGLMRIVKLAEDGHTYVFPREGSALAPAYPIRFRSFPDGLFVIAADPEHAAVVGGKVIALGGRKAEDVLADVDAFAPGDNKGCVRYRAQVLLSMAAVHRALGLSDPEGRARLTVEDRDGKRSEVLVGARGTGSPVFAALPEGWAVAKAAGAGPVAVSFGHQERSYWFEHLESAKTVYFQWNAVEQDLEEPFAAFCARLFEFVESHDVEKLVIDLRNNGGGNNYLNQPLVHGLIRSAKVNRPGRLFVITGPVTFSAAVNCATEIERETYALFAGEPTGAGPNMYGDASRLPLRGSGLDLWCSTLTWQKSDPRDTRRAMLPDLPATMRFADYSAGRDPALEAVLAFRVESAESYGRMAPNQHWRRASQRAR